MENPIETTFAEEHPFATDMGTALATSAASVVGMMVGTLLVGGIMGKLKARKAEKVNPIETIEE